MIWHKIVFHLKFLTDTCTKHQIENQNLGFKHTASQGGVGGPNIFAYLGTYVLFVEQPVVSLSLYNGAIQWPAESVSEGQTAPFEKVCQKSVITDSNF